MIIVWHVGSARLAFRRRHGIEGSLTAVESARPVPEEFAGAPVQRTGRPILVTFNPTSRIRSWKSGFYDFSGFVSS